MTANRIEIDTGDAEEPGPHLEALRAKVDSRIEELRAQFGDQTFDHAFDFERSGGVYH
jgi:hypothetical protein